MAQLFLFCHLRIFDTIKIDNKKYSVYNIKHITLQHYNLSIFHSIYRISKLKISCLFIHILPDIYTKRATVAQI